MSPSMRDVSHQVDKTWKGQVSHWGGDVLVTGGLDVNLGAQVRLEARQEGVCESEVDLSEKTYFIKPHWISGGRMCPTTADLFYRTKHTLQRPNAGQWAMYFPHQGIPHLSHSTMGLARIHTVPSFQVGAGPSKEAQGVMGTRKLLVPWASAVGLTLGITPPILHTDAWVSAEAWGRAGAEESS